MSDLKGKRLLFLGATGLMCSAVETAKRMGIYTIVTDYYPNAVAKSIADRKYDVSTTDIDALERLARDERVDGVFTGFSDVNLYSAQALCQRLGLPFYATREQLELTTNKLKFKEMCRSHGVPIVKQYELDARCLPEHLAKIEYPVIVKPADSYASKGCSVCQNREELLDAVKKALAFSPLGQIIVEQYMDPNRCGDIVIDYFFADGRPHLTFVGDRFTNTEQAGMAPLAAAIISPSRYVDEYIRDVDKAAKAMFAAIHVTDGRVFIQAFHDEHGFYFYEMGFRLSGGNEYIPVWKELGIDELEALIRYALTGHMLERGAMVIANPRYKACYCNLVFLCSAGTISRIEGLETVRSDDRVLQLAQLLRPGDTVEANGTLSQVLCRIYLQAENRSRLETAIREIGASIVAYDQDGRPMMLKIYGSGH